MGANSGRLKPMVLGDNMPMTMAQMVLGGIFVRGNAAATEISETGVWAKVGVFNQGISGNGTISDHENSRIIIEQPGSYLGLWSVCVQAQSENLSEIVVWINGQTQSNIYAGPHRIDFAGQSSCDRMSRFGDLPGLAVGDFVELWCRDTVHTSDLMFANAALAILRVGD